MDIGFAMKQIETKQFAIIEEAYKDCSSMSLSLDLNFSTNKNDRVVAASVLFKLQTQSATFLIIEVCCFFEIKEDSWKSFSDDKGVVILPKSLLSFLAMHTIGTTRGVLHAKTENTKYNRFILPPINVAELVKEDLKV